MIVRMTEKVTVLVVFKQSYQQNQKLAGTPELQK
jgi:hypothetical protein